ncbi:DUF924 family protein [Candidatus Binatus sp.]|uniref:DUF924 family protein n=1 Tax=Candidatus Binatus sp. TaxID=2811406 RepID=UPI003C8CF632
MREARDEGQNAASDAETVLRFWFADEPGSRESMFQSRWFFPTPEFDRLCTTRFLASYEDAAHGRLEDWKNGPRSCLALVLLLDQFPRNMFRDTARAFATDAKARELTRHAIASGFDRDLSPIMRMFLYLPLEHSENLNDQLESVQLTSELVSENRDYTEILQHAEQHLEVFRRFGRFPGRNHALGRQSTREEMNFLKDQKWR